MNLHIPIDYTICLNRNRVKSVPYTSSMHTSAECIYSSTLTKNRINAALVCELQNVCIEFKKFGILEERDIRNAVFSQCVRDNLLGNHTPFSSTTK